VSPSTSFKSAARRHQRQRRATTCRCGRQLPVMKRHNTARRPLWRFTDANSQAMSLNSHQGKTQGICPDLPPAEQSGEAVNDWHNGPASDRTAPLPEGQQAVLTIRSSRTKQAARIGPPITNQPLPNSGGLRLSGAPGQCHRRSLRSSIIDNGGQDRNHRRNQSAPLRGSRHRMPGHACHRVGWRRKMQG